MKKSIAVKTIALILALMVCFSTLSAVGAAAVDQLGEQIAVSDAEDSAEVTETDLTEETEEPRKASGATGFLIGIPAVLLGGGIAAAVIFIKQKKDEE